MLLGGVHVSSIIDERECGHALGISAPSGLVKSALVPVA
jgi:hypothetical protein